MFAARLVSTSVLQLVAGDTWCKFGFTSRDFLDHAASCLQNKRRQKSFSDLQKELKKAESIILLLEEHPILPNSLKAFEKTKVHLKYAIQAKTHCSHASFLVHKVCEIVTQHEHTLHRERLFFRFVFSPSVP